MQETLPRALPGVHLLSKLNQNIYLSTHQA